MRGIGLVKAVRELSRLQPVLPPFGFPDVLLGVRLARLGSPFWTNLSN